MVTPLKNDTICIQIVGKDPAKVVGEQRLKRGFSGGGNFNLTNEYVAFKFLLHNISERIGMKIQEKALERLIVK